jgi:hypothetical protein
MRVTTIFLFTVLSLASCNSVKRNQKFLASGNYDQAIDLAVKKLSKDKNSNNSGDHILLLEEAFKKAKEKDVRRIKFLEKDQNPTANREIYYTYRNLEKRQERIRPLLPLHSDVLGRSARFKLVDYSDKIVAAKNKFADDLYAEATTLLSYSTIPDARAAYERLDELHDIKPNYTNLNALLNDARFQGTDFVKVSLNNRSGQIIPARLLRDLLDFNTYGLDDFWTEYHVNREVGVDYSFGISLNFREIVVSPERVSEKEYHRKKRIKDGWKYKLDRNGNVMKDSLGNDIKTDVYKVVTARVMYTKQSKNVLVGGDVLYRDLLKGRDIDRHPLASQFVFENEFAKFRGDERSLTETDLDFMENDFIPFPSNSQMILDAGDDIKARLKDILKNNSLR